MPSSPKLLWNQTDIQRLKELHAEGKSFGQIADIFKMTRNAVIGKAHRLGLKGNKPKTVLPSRPTQKKPVKSSSPRQPKKPPLIFRSVDANRVAPSIDLITKADDAVSMGVKLSKLEWADGKPSNCRAVLRGQGRDVVYCGKANVGGSSYCQHHTERFYAPRYHRPHVSAAKPVIASK